jgi:hypothetical protein
MDHIILDKLKERIALDKEPNKALLNILGIKPNAVLPTSKDTSADLSECFEMDYDQQLDVDEIPMWHDVKDKYAPLETYLGSLDEGCAFGELAMVDDGKNITQRKRNYSAIAT